ncbi:N-acetylmuramidase family protein [Aquamicrobium sp. NLF2-7]|uniref:N-acetylmuramidase family protein n=1 Tax=Aquamicrobium sp. NLF2-7 TaxID=2918753 RepID=UPI001EFB96D1|nr:N-acetylmuramidase family protein [Aquamicrobium sp. NLF2-7]MCG8273110.1 N-acetylmuramidase family protein [Aquamicrobium sp. NLF2-7]
MFDDDVRREIERVAKARGWGAAQLLAVAEVESGGRAFAIVNGQREPLIRWEGHYFDKRLSGARQAQARKAGLADPKAGAIPNPSTQAGRWKLFERAAAIDRQAAIESVSWGIGQVMGAHWKWLGYRSAEDLLLDARNGVYGQVRLMANFIDKAGLAPALAKRDWAAFARGYNGPAYAKNRYDSKLAAAYQRYVNLPPLPASGPKPPEKPVDAPEPTKPATPAENANHAPLPAQESRRGILAKVLAALGVGTGGATAAKLTQGEADQLAAFMMFVGFVAIAVILIMVIRRKK